MKKILVSIVLAISTLSLAGCFKRDVFEDITVYTTVYPVEYITNYLYGEHSTVLSIYPNGVNPSTYELTDKQIKDYSKGGLFVFNGTSSEKNYIVPMFQHNKNLKIIDSALTMEYTNEVEELWLDPSNFLMMSQNIRNGLKEYINHHYLITEIDENYEELRLNISNIDAKLKLVTDSANYKTIVVSSDLFQFLSKYNFNVISLEENDNLTEKTVANVKSLIQSGQISYIFLREGEEVSNTVKAIQKETGVQTVEFHSISNLTEDQRKNGTDYISLMNDNIELLKQELYD